MPADPLHVRTVDRLTEMMAAGPIVPNPMDMYHFAAADSPTNDPPRTSPSWLETPPNPEAPMPSPTAELSAPVPTVEADHRRPDFIGEIPVVLADGATWYLKRPRIRVGLRDDQHGKIALTSMVHFGPDYEHRLDALERAQAELVPVDDPSAPDPTFDAFLAAQFELAAELIRQNYTLFRPEALRLVACDFGDEGEAARMRLMLEVARGIAPKPTPATSAAS